MSSSILARYVNPWKFKREQEQLQRIAELRGRDGDDCRRCRRPMRFDLSSGHDLMPKIEAVAATPDGEEPVLDNLCLTHRRCSAEGVDLTREVLERVRRKNEADLFVKSRKRA
jgi:hypothetical protein